VVPGIYYLLLGSGSHKQRIVKSVVVVESQVIPVIPDWSALNIEVADETNQPFRGDYEIVRIDDFEPFGRGKGRDPNLGERTKTWILNPGIYKIFSVGQNFNSFTNFVTVRLLPGEFTHFTLVENKTDFKILGGGTLFSKTSSAVTSNWRFGINTSAGIDFNYVHNKLKDTVTQNENDFTALLDFRADYRKDHIEQNGRIKIDESFSIVNFDFSELKNKTDQLKLSSILTWHIRPKFGPYGRIEFTTGIISQRLKKPASLRENFYFVLIEDNSIRIDSLVDYIRTQPPFSPITLETGTGLNIKIINVRFLESNLLAGIGFTYEKSWREWFLQKTDTLITDTVIKNFLKDKAHYLLTSSNEYRTEIGPEALLNVILRLGKYATVETELKYFSPFTRIEKPDIYLTNVLSWRIARMLMLDYEFKYTLVQAKEENHQQNETSHRILIRFSLNTR
jgi:hypothetical protein